MSPDSVLRLGAGFLCAMLMASHGACAAGQGGPDDNCPTTWSTPFEGVSSEEIARLGDKLYAVGGLDGEAWLVDVDPCTGEVRRTLTFGVDERPAHATNVSRLGNDLYITGFTTSDASNPGRIIFAEVDEADWQVTWANQIPSTGGNAMAHGMASDQNRLWMTGSFVAPDQQQHALAMFGNPDGTACSMEVGTGVGSAPAVAVHGTDVYIPTVSERQLVLHRFDADLCTACPCTPDWSSEPVIIGAAQTAAYGIVITDDGAYVAGLAEDGGFDLYGFVVRFDLDSGLVTATQTWNPTPVADGFLAVTADDKNLYLVGGSGWEGDPGFVSSTGALLVLPLSDITATPREIGDGIHSYRLIESVAVDAAGDGIYVLGNSDSGVATLARCPKTGACVLPSSGPDPDGGIPADAAIPGDAASDAASDAGVDATIPADAAVDGGSSFCPEVVLQNSPGLFYNRTQANPVRWYQLSDPGTRYQRIEVEFDFTFPQWRDGAVPSTEYAFEYFVWHLFTNYSSTNASGQEAGHWGWLNGFNIRNKSWTLAYSTFLDFQWTPPQTFASGDWQPLSTYHVHTVNDTVNMRLIINVTKDGQPFHAIDQPLVLSPEATTPPSPEAALLEAYTGGLKLMLGKPADSILVPPRPVPYHMIPYDFSYSNLLVTVIEGEPGSCVLP